MEILSYISELLLLNDCVIIPNFGGFVANYKPAGITGSLFTPPNHSVNFNSKLNFNDGLLTSHVSTEEEISYLAAKKRIDALVAEMNYRLTEGEAIIIPQVGTLKYDEQHHLEFTPSGEINLNVNAYGLKEFSYKSLLGDKLSSTVGNRTDAQAIRPTAKPKHLRRVLWATPVLLALLAIPFRHELYSLQESNLFRINETTPVEMPIVEETTPAIAETTLEIVEAETVAEPSEMAALPVETNEQTTADEATPDVAINNAPVAVAQNQNFHLIVGSFKDKENADQLVSNLRNKGLDAQNLGIIRGLNYVSASSFSSIEEAQAAKLDFAKNHSEFNGSWVYAAK